MFTFSSYNMSCAEMTSKVGVAHKISLARAVHLAPPTVNPGSAPATQAMMVAACSFPAPYSTLLRAPCSHASHC